MSFVSLQVLSFYSTLTKLPAAALCFQSFNLGSIDRHALLAFGAPLAAGCVFAVALILLIARSRERRLADSRRALERELTRAREAADLNMSAVESLAIAIDAKDQTTHGHVRRTRVYAVELGKLLNVSAAELEALKAGALLHDVGKLAVPDHILNKPGKLTAAEFEKMKVHTTVGASIISRVGFPFPVGALVRHHHEKWDGSGYPDGLKGREIPLVARIIAVVDFYDTTRCDRPYRAGMAREESLALLERMAGKSFDPEVVEVFVRNVGRFDRLISAEDLSEQVQQSKAVESQTESFSASQTESLTDKADARGDSSGFRTIAEAQREVFALHEIAQTIGSTLNLQDTVALVAGKLRSIVPFDTCVIYVVNELSGRAESVYSVGALSEHFEGRRVQVGDGITGWVIANARTMSGAHPELDTAGLPSEVASQIGDVLSSPLAREDGAFGAVTLYSTRGSMYSAEHARLLETVCLHASSALNNAITHERTRQSALTDTLTGLPNSRALRLMLDQRVAESRRVGQGMVAVLSLDVDGFAQINEAFGHGVGDRLLASVASVVKNQLRQMDMLARQGGDEFVAVMPGASAEVAAQVAERVRAAVESHEFVVKTGRTVHVGVSAGVACYPDDGPTADDLLRAATQSLQRNKHAKAHTRGPASVVSIDSYR
jgi:diguanylate cyclase (GGDEF)-like protein/putative nucleotidyltransferase with HDIG domain